MIRRTCDFDVDAWQALIHEQADNRLTLTLTNHLEVCDECRQRFEALAAPADWWQETSDVLATERTLCSSLATKSTHADLPASHWSHFLSPSNTPDSIGSIGSYAVRRVLGVGGMGVVFEAFDPTLHRNVAVKIMHPHFAISGAARQRFGREARAAAAVVHSNVVPIHAVITEDKLPYLVMSYIPGESLQERLDRQGNLDFADCLSIASQIADGLAAAHSNGLIHRDIKPANILLEQGTPRVWLTDFGLARTLDDATVTASGYIAGTPQYMSPEQANGDDIDHRSDIFSLGSVLYTMIAGRPAFRAESSLAVLRRIVDHEPRRLNQIRSDTPLWLEAIVAKLLSKTPADRFGDIANVRDLLRQCSLHLTNPQHVPLPAAAVQLTSVFRSQQRPITPAPKILLSYRVFILTLVALSFGCIFALSFGISKWLQIANAPSSDAPTSDAPTPNINQSNPPAQEQIPQQFSQPPTAQPNTRTPYVPAYTPYQINEIDWYSIDNQLQELRRDIDRLQSPYFPGASISHDK